MFENYYFRRVAAKAIDLLAAFAFASLLPPLLGLPAGMGFLMFSDAIGGGEGFGKRFFKLRVVDASRVGQFHAISWKQSTLRNIPFMVLLAFTSVAILGGLLGVLFGVPYCLFEIYLFVSVSGHQRLGDVLANTSVIEEKIGAQSENEEG